MRTLLDQIKIQTARREFQYDLFKARALEACQRSPGTRSEGDAALIIAYLRFHNQLQTVSDEAKLLVLFRRAVYRFYMKEEYLFMLGDEPDFYYFIIKGCIGLGVMGATTTITRCFGAEMEDVFFLKNGFGFGEVAIVENCKRTRSAQAAKDSHCLAFGKEDAMALFSLTGQAIANRNVGMVKKMPQFAALPETKKKQVAMMGRFQDYKIGQQIVAQNSSGKAVYFVRFGKVEVRRLVERNQVSEAVLARHKKALQMMKFPVSVKLCEVSGLSRRKWVFRSTGS